MEIIQNGHKAIYFSFKLIWQINMYLLHQLSALLLQDSSMPDLQQFLWVCCFFSNVSQKIKDAIILSFTNMKGFLIHMQIQM